jgi:hypothetical protein
LYALPRVDLGLGAWRNHSDLQPLRSFLYFFRNLKVKKRMGKMTMKVKQGDRILEDHGEKVVLTRFKGSTHNFGPVSSRDFLVNTCERPGSDTKGEKTSTP